MARTVTGEERKKLWQQALKFWPPYADYALKTAGREIDHEMLAHLVDHGLDVLLLAGLQRLFGKADFFPAALQVDQRRIKPRYPIAQQIIERRPPERIEPPLVRAGEEVGFIVLGPTGG